MVIVYLVLCLLNFLILKVFIVYFEVMVSYLFYFIDDKGNVYLLSLFFFNL